jgi:hypothetical protein
VPRRADVVGFTVLPRRWVVERTLAWLNRNRRLAKDFEATIASAKAWLYLASVQLLLSLNRQRPCSARSAPAAGRSCRSRFCTPRVTVISGVQQPAAQAVRKVLRCRLLEDRFGAVGRDDTQVCHHFCSPPAYL